MKAENFCFWLQGFFELGSGAYAGLTADQVAQIKTHLALVFKHDPTMAHDPPQDVPKPESNASERIQRALEEYEPPERNGRPFSDGVLFC